MQQLSQQPAEDDDTEVKVRCTFVHTHALLHIHNYDSTPV